MNRAPAGTITTRADNSQWQAPVDPNAEWKQIKDGDSTPQSKRKPMQVEGVGGATEGALGHRLLRSKYDLDGYSPSDEVHPDHVDVDTDGDIDGKPVLSWQHEGRKQRSYTMNFHQRKHRHQFAAIVASAPALTNAPAALLERYNASESEGDRYLAAHFMVECGHTADQLLGIQIGHVGTTLMKGRSAGKSVLLRHASGGMFQWSTRSPALAAHVKRRVGSSPTAPLFLCGPDCIASALAEVGLGDVSQSTIRAHAQSRMAVDLLSKAKRVKLDSLGAGLDKVRGNIAEASQKIAEFYGHPQAPANMAYVPPHVQAAYLEACGGGTIFKNTYNELNMRKSVSGRDEELLWQHAEAQVMKSIPSVVPLTEIPNLVRTLYETLKPNQTSILSKLTSTNSPSSSPTESRQTESRQTESRQTESREPTLDSTMAAELMELEKSQSSLSTLPTTQPMESSDPTQTSANQGHRPTSSPTTTKSVQPDSPTEALTSTASPSSTSGPSPEHPSLSTTKTSPPVSETATHSSQLSKSHRVFDTKSCADLMAGLLVKGAQGIIGESGIEYFKSLYSQIACDPTALKFITAVTSFVAEVNADAALVKAGSVAGTRGDPLGRVATHADGSRWRKVAFGKWERVGGDKSKDKSKSAGPASTQRDSVQVAMLRDRVKSLRDRWHTSTSTTQRAAVVKELTSIKATIRQMSAAAMRKSQADPDGTDELALEVRLLLTEWKSDLFRSREAEDGWVRPTKSVVEAAKYHLRTVAKSSAPHLTGYVVKSLARGEPISPQMVRDLQAEGDTDVAAIGGDIVHAWTMRVAPKLTIAQHQPIQMSRDVAAVRDYVPEPVETRYIKDYISDSDHYDIRKSLTARDYVSRIASDMSGATTELRVMLVSYGYDKTVATVADVLNEVRNG